MNGRGKGLVAKEPVCLELQVRGAPSKVKLLSLEDHMFGLYFKCLLGWVSNVGLNQEGHGSGSQSKSSSGLCSKLGLDGPVLGLDPDLTPKRANQLEKDVEALAGCGLAQEDGRMCLSKGSPSALGPFLSPCPEGFIQKEGTLALMSPSATNVGDMGSGKRQGKMGHENVESFSEKGSEKTESRYEGAFPPLPSSVFFFVGSLLLEDLFAKVGTSFPSM